MTTITRPRLGPTIATSAIATSAQGMPEGVGRCRMRIVSIGIATPRPRPNSDSRTGRFAAYAAIVPTTTPTTTASVFGDDPTASDVAPVDEAASSSRRACPCRGETCGRTERIAGRRQAFARNWRSRVIWRDEWREDRRPDDQRDADQADPERRVRPQSTPRSRCGAADPHFDGDGGRSHTAARRAWGARSPIGCAHVSSLAFMQSKVCPIILSAVPSISRAPTLASVPEM